VWIQISIQDMSDFGSTLATETTTTTSEQTLDNRDDNHKNGGSQSNGQNESNSSSSNSSGSGGSSSSSSGSSSSGTSSDSLFYVNKTLPTHETCTYEDDPIKDSDFQENLRLWETEKDSKSWGAPIFQRETSKHEHLTIWKRKVTDIINEYKAKGTTPFALDHYFQFNIDLDFHKVWDANALVLEHLANVGNCELIYWLVKYPWPMSHRAYYYLRRFKKMILTSSDGKGQEINYLWISRTPPKDYGLCAKEIQQKKYTGMVLVDRYESRGVFRAAPSAPDKATEWVVTAIDDPKANISKMIMTWIIETALPSFFETLKKSCLGYESYLQKTKKREETQSPPQLLKLTSTTPS